MTRTHRLDALSIKDIKKEVTLSGWVHSRRDHGGLIFIDLRDRYGITQLVFDPKRNPDCHEKAYGLRGEYVISVKGKVAPRAPGMANKDLKTGEVEVEVHDLEILSTSKPLPFSIGEKIDATEELRLKYRYLDIRRGDLLDKLKMRHKIMQITRNFFSDLDFLEISTPILAKSTPEGARDYLVPSRIYPGNFYALPQSPQIFKQLLMVSGVDKYFQISPCFRDEDLRADRQPEFTQIDIEYSFSNPENLYSMIEKYIATLFEKCLDVKIPDKFKRMSFADCVENYGTDRPDLRFGMSLVRLDSIIERSDFSILKEQIKNGGIVKGICVKQTEGFSRKKIDKCIEFVKDFSLKGLAYMKKTEDGYSSNIVKFFSEDLLKELSEKMDMEIGDLLLIAAGPEDIVNQGLDHLRRHIADMQNLIDPDHYEFLWVVDFPLFKQSDGKLKSEHHPFTHPYPEDIPLLDTDPLKVRSYGYDLVVNGYELGGGSQRIHNFDLQKKIFALLGLSEKETQEKFGFFIDALQYGTPPHLGIAFGLDRIAMILCKTDNIRDVIAFPKTTKASDLMMRAPSQVSEDQLKETHIKTEPTPIPWP